MRLPQSSSKPPSVRVVSATILLTFAAMLPTVAQAATKQLVCSPAAIRFGTVTMGQSESQIVILTNTGQTSATISAVSLSDSEFSVSGLNLPKSLGAGQSIPLNVTFAPTTSGWAGGVVAFTSNAANPTLQLQTEGAGGSSESLTAAPSSLSFGQVSVGSRAALSVRLTNTRSWKETLKKFQIWGSGFAVSGPPTPIVLIAGQSITLSISFSPQASGLAGGDLFIFGPGLNVPLAGTGTTTTIGQLTIAPTALNFGNVDVGTTTTQPSSISAIGGSVTVSSAASSNSQFAISGASFPLTISAGQSVAFDVAFSPSQSGSSSSALTFTSNASDSHTSESLTGTGVLPQHKVDLSWSPSNSPVVGYNVYRCPQGGVYSKINAALDPTTTYTDSTVVSGTTYYYAATAVNSAGEESSYSAHIKVAIP